MARASTVIGLTMLGATGVGAATIPFMGSSSGGAHGVAGMRCDAHRFPTVAACQAAGHAACRPDGTNFVPANCSTGGGSSGTRWYNSHPIYWFGGGHGGTTTTRTGGTPQTVTTTTHPGGGTTTTTGGGTSQRGGFGGSVTSHGGSSGSS